MAAVVAIKSRVSGAVLDHFYHRSIAAFDAVTIIHERNWRRAPVGDGVVEFTNAASGKRLGASLGRHAQAFDATGELCRAQWREIDTGDGHFLLQNRATGHLLCLEDGACVKLTPSTPEARRDHATHWCYVWLREPPRDATVAIRSVSSGNALDHYYEKSLAAMEADYDRSERRWHRVPVDAGFAVYRTATSGKLLAHFKGHCVVTDSTDIDDAHVQWREMPVADGEYALENRATRALLRDGSGVSIVAVTPGTTDATSDPQNRWSFLLIDGTPSLPTWRQDAIVALRNRESGTVMEHHCGEHIAAYDDDVDHPNSQWYRVHVGGGFVSYKNVATGQILQHFREEIINADVSDEATPSEACQWKEIDLGGGFFALQNRHTQALLRFECRDWITAVMDELSGGRSDYSSQWSFVDVRAAR